jgi:hypothetical protein
MFKRLCLLTTTLLLVAVTVRAEEPAPYNCDFSPSCEVAPGIYGAMGSPVQSKFNLSIGGFVKLDYAHNTQAVGPISAGPPGSLPAGGSKEESVFTAKQSRFWLRVAGPAFLGAKTNALVEMDFYGTGSLGNEFGNLRMRHAYGSMDWTDTQILFGQFNDLFAPAAADTIDGRFGGTTGTPARPRTPQIRLTQKVNLNADNTLKFALAVENPMQDNATQAPAVAGVPGFLLSGGDNSSSTTNGYGSLVNVAAHINFSSKALGVSPYFMGLGMSPLQLTLFGLGGSQKIAGNHHVVDVYGYGVYGFVPLIKSRDGKNRAMTLSLETQAYMAAGLDVEGATAVALVHALPNQTAAKGFGVYGQLKFFPTQDMGITCGYMHRGASNYADYKATPAFEKYNESIYCNVTYDLNAAVRMATEYAHDATQYGAKVGTTGANYGQNNIFRVAAYYFF